MNGSMVALVTGAQVAFWVVAPIIVCAALGVVVCRRAVHSALCLALVMVCLSVQYAALDAPFLFVSQIVVYTGAILMLFLFVVMLVGVDRSDSVVETLRGHRAASVLAGIGLVLLLVTAVGHGVISGDTGLGAATASAGGNVPGLAQRIFTRWAFPFEATSALLITAAVAAMVLAHGERLRRKAGQRELMEQRMHDYATRGEHPGPLPSSGVFARTNAIGAPALLPDGRVAEASVSPTLVSRSAIVDAGELRAPTAAVYAEIEQAAADDEEARR